jgi:hypothetical protein
MLSSSGIKQALPLPQVLLQSICLQHQLDLHRFVNAERRKVLTGDSLAQQSFQFVLLTHHTAHTRVLSLQLPDFLSQTNIFSLKILKRGSVCAWKKRLPLRLADSYLREQFGVFLGT